MNAPRIQVQTADFDIGAEIRRLTCDEIDVGAVVAFAGVCRGEEGRLAAIELEHYPGMAEEEIGRIAREASQRWPLAGLTIIHRFGRIVPGENIVLVATASSAATLTMVGSGGRPGRAIFHGGISGGETVNGA